MCACVFVCALNKVFVKKLFELTLVAKHTYNVEEFIETLKSMILANLMLLKEAKVNVV